MGRDGGRGMVEVGATPPGLEECEDDTTNFVIKTTASGKNTSEQTVAKWIMIEMSCG